MHSQHTFRPNLALAFVGFTVLFGLALAGLRSLQARNSTAASAAQPAANPVGGGGNIKSASAVGAPPTPTARFATHTPGGPLLTPTPDDPHPLPAVRSQVEQYTVQLGDSLAGIAQRFQVNVDQLVQENNLSNPNHVEVGQVLTIPLPSLENSGSSFKVIPDSELVDGPAAAEFDLAGFIASQAGYLSSYQEKIGDRTYSGTKIVSMIAQDYSVNPRLLLAALEYQSGWVTRSNPPQATLDYPMRLVNPSRSGLYKQLSWAADQLNRGYYLWRVNGAGVWLLADGSAVGVSPLINAGTAGVQNLFAGLTDRAGWNEAVSEGGLFETYNALFGYPFDYAVEPLLPPDLKQPVLQLPFEKGKTWSFTGGPHGGWAEGSAWAALDFGPPGDTQCYVPSEEWVTAVGNGPIVRAGDGAVIQDLDSQSQPADGLEQTGWTILYLHIAASERVQPGDYVKAGEPIGHPSCEGGVSNATHLHIARKYNGEWIPADQPDVPFVMDGWVSSGAGKEYDGYLTNGDEQIEAYFTRDSINEIRR